MPYDIIVGRNSSDKILFGDKGLVYLGKSYVNMGNQTSLSNKIWLDIVRPHVILIAGKRGSGKSYTLGAIAEELSNLPKETSKNIASLIFDTMGIFWTMKYKNEKDSELLEQWGLESKSLPTKIFIPFGKKQDYQKKGIPFDEVFSIKTSELEAEDWLSIFNINLTSILGVSIERIIANLKEKNQNFTIEEIKTELEKDKKISQENKEIIYSLFSAADSWGIFSKSLESAEIEKLIIPGTTSVLDISTYSSVSTFNIRSLVISIISKKLFKIRMESRKKEELDSIQHGQDYLSYSQKKESPIIWIFIDEAHEFIPKDEVTPSTEALKQLLREGRQPGISLVLATQQPGQIHKDAITQADIVISHRVTAKADIDALNEIMQTYLAEDIKQQIDSLPSLKGSAILLDDNAERIFPIRIRPRFTWHGGEAPTTIKSEL